MGEEDGEQRKGAEEGESRGWASMNTVLQVKADERCDVPTGYRISSIGRGLTTGGLTWYPSLQHSMTPQGCRHLGYEYFARVRADALSCTRFCQLPAKPEDAVSNAAFCRRSKEVKLLYERCRKGHEHPGWSRGEVLVLLYRMGCSTYKSTRAATVAMNMSKAGPHIARRFWA